LENGEYRSAQSMQKDFILIMQNCVKFNAADSDVVKEARQQTLMRPTALKNAAIKHKLFLAEDGSVLEILEEKVNTNPDGTPKKKRKRRSRAEMEADAAKEALEKKVIKRRRKKKEVVKKEDDDTDDEEDAPIANLKKPRIKISMNGDEKKKRAKKSKTEDSDDEVAEDEALQFQRRSAAENLKGKLPRRRRGRLKRRRRKTARKSMQHQQPRRRQQKSKQLSR